jgi:tRNA(Ile)-lysidine synthase
MPGLTGPAIDLPGLMAAARGSPLADAARLAIAVSGGPDSLALLGLAVAAFPGRVTALTVDHGLRAESAAEAAGVAAQCAARGIPHHVLRWDDGAPGPGVQAAARTARYRLLGDWCAAHRHDVLLTAHHADDQAETLLMRLARGAGAGGLAGIRACRPLAPDVQLVRPLLGVRRATLAALATAQSWQVVDDPSNHNPDFTRTQARQLLAGADWLDVPAMAAAAAHLADAETALAWAAARAWDGRVEQRHGALWLDVADLPAELVQRLLRRAITSLNPDAAPRGPDLARLAARLAAGGSGTLAGVQAKADGKTGLWLLQPAPPPRHLRRNGTNSA